MLAKEVHALLALQTGLKTVKQLAEAINSTYVRASQITGRLIQKGFAAKADGFVNLANTAHATLFRKIAARHDVEKLLSDSNEDVALALLTSNDIRGIQELTGLSYWTVKRSLNKIMETGIIKEANKKYYLAGDEDVKLFLRLWKEEKQKHLVEPYAEIAHASQHFILKKSPHGRSAKGSLTAFSAFSRYGVEMHPVHAYYIQPERKVNIEEILVHAVVFSTNPVELTDCAVFYAKNKDKIDLSRVRETARKFNVHEKIVDLENYVKNLTVTAPEQFLPWNEFAEKAQLYGVSPESLLPPKAFPDITDELSRKLRSEAKLYLFGGEAMRIKELKRATKDVDIALDNTQTFTTIQEALTSMGYRPLGDEEISRVDRKLNPSGIFVKEASPRVDIFVKTICNAFNLSNSMKSRCTIKEIGNLKLHIMSNEDLFLLKSVTDREGDIYDMAQLAKASKFNWRTVLNELYSQEQKTRRHFCMSLLNSVEAVEKRANIRAPFHNQLENHCIDHAILESVRKWKATTLKQIRKLINYPDYRLRSRIKKLVKEGKLTNIKEFAGTLKNSKTLEELENEQSQFRRKTETRD